MAEVKFKERIAPQSIEAEQSTLGAMLIDRDAVARASEMLRPSDFYLDVHQIIFDAIRHLFDGGQPVDIITTSEELRKAGRLEYVGGATYLSTLMDAVPSAKNIEQYASIVQEKAILRGLIAASDQIAGWAYDGADESVETLVDRAEKTLLQVGQRRIGQYFYHIDPLLLEAFEQLDHKGGGPPGLPTGFHDLDRLTSGLQKADFIVVAGRPGMGKTALCLNIAANVALQSQVPVAVFSLEMSKEQLVQRLIASQARVDGHRIRTARLSDDEIRRISDAVSAMYNKPIYVDDTPGISTFEIRAKARRLMSELRTLGLIIVDYLQLVRGPKMENRVQEISEIARSLKSLARELGVPVIALSQLSRAVEQRDEKRPMLSDLRESGSIEAEADLVIFIYRESYYKKKKKDTENEAEDELDSEHGGDEAEIIVGKHRNGPTGVIKLTFLKRWTRFVDYYGE